MTSEFFKGVDFSAPVESEKKTYEPLTGNFDLLCDDAKESIASVNGRDVPQLEIQFKIQGGNHDGRLWWFKCRRDLDFQVEQCRQLFHLLGHQSPPAVSDLIGERVRAKLYAKNGYTNLSRWLPRRETQTSQAPPNPAPAPAAPWSNEDGMF